MDNEKLKLNLEYLANKYIVNNEVRQELQVHIDNLKAKFILGEIDRNKNVNYSDSDRELIKDIYFYYC